MPPTPPRAPSGEYGKKTSFVAKNKWYLVGGGIVGVGGIIYFVVKSHSTAATNNAANTTANGSLGTTTGGEQYLIPSGAGYGGYTGGGGGDLYNEISSLEADITGLTSALTGYTPPSAGSPPGAPAITNGIAPAPAGSGSPSGSSGSTGGNAGGSGGGSAGSTSPPVAVTNTVQTYGVGNFDTTVNNTLLDQALTAIQTTGAPATVAQQNALATFASEGHVIGVPPSLDPTAGAVSSTGIGTDSTSAVEGQHSVSAPSGGMNETLAAQNAKYGGIAGNPSMYG